MRRRYFLQFTVITAAFVKFCCCFQQPWTSRQSTSDAKYSRIKVLYGAYSAGDDASDNPSSSASIDSLMPACSHLSTVATEARVNPTSAYPGLQDELDGDPFSQPIADQRVTHQNETSMIGPTTIHHSQPTMFLLSRRKWIQLGAVAATGAITVGLVGQNVVRQSIPGAHTSSSNTRKKDIPRQTKRLQRVNVTKVIRESSINMTMECTITCVSLDRATFEKKETLKLPSWVPSVLVPPPRTIRKLTDSEIIVAAIVAGSTVEMVRTTLLYPLLTLKNRIQADIKRRVRTGMKRGNRRKIHPRRRAKILKLNAVRHLREGKLYAGIVPSLLVSVPATGVYYGVRDVVKRALVTMPGMGDLTAAVLAAFIADVVSLMIRTPTDALALRLQVATGKESRFSNETEEEKDQAVQEMVGDWLVASLKRLPAVILTDLPYLLSRIVLNRYLIHGNIDIGRYELTAITTALICGFLTTPFDVARTRILVDSDDDPTNGIDGGSGMGLITTMQTIAKEGDGGVANLFAGWLERSVYLGIGRAWIEPVQILGYMAIRDAILLEWFD